MSRSASATRAVGTVRLLAAVGVAVLLAAPACSEAPVRAELSEALSGAGPTSASLAPVPASSTSEAALLSPTTASVRTTAGDAASDQPAPTSTWVVFEEVPELVVFDGLRVPQSDGDVKGPLFDVNPSLSQSRQEREAAGTVLDLCRLEDMLVERHWPYELPEVGDLSPDERRELTDRLLGLDCRGAEAVAAEPLLGYRVGRYRVFGVDGLEGRYFRTREEAAAWYERHAVEQQERYENTLRPDAELFGSMGYPVEFSARDSPVDEVQVLAGTVSVTGGMLRGLVRNWSRTLWAYDVRVEADGREFWWPLSIQPGEAAPFEIDGWEGSVDPSQVVVSVAAEMSNDADVSRSWWMLPYPQVIEPGGWRHQPPPEVLDELPADAVRLVDAGGVYNFPASHPSLRGEFADGVEFELAVYVAFLGDDGTVTNLLAPTPYSKGRHLLAPGDGVLPSGARQSTDIDDRMHYLPFVVRHYPVPERGVSTVNALFDGTDEERWVMWMGAVHRAPAP